MEVVKFCERSQFLETASVGRAGWQATGIDTAMPDFFIYLFLFIF